MTPLQTAATLTVIALGSCGLSLAFTAFLIRFCKRIGFVDRPGDSASHKSHREPMPYGGGIAIFVACWLPMIAAMIVAFASAETSFPGLSHSSQTLVRDLLGGLRDHASQAGVLLAGAAALLILGIFDDARPLGPLVKLPVIAAVALFVTLFGEVRIAEFAPRPVSIALTTLWLIVIINALNFLDNMDGLAAGVAAICAAFLLVCGAMAGQQIIPAVAAVFLGAVLGFLFWNFPPARIFMGDAGSLVLGYMLAVISVLTSYWESGGAKPAFPLAMPLVVLALPLYDFCSVVVIRVLEGRNPLKGDQRHFSHRLVDHGFSRRFAVLTIYLATATTGLAATLLPTADLGETLRILGICVMVLLIVAILESSPGKES